MKVLIVPGFTATDLNGGGPGAHSAEEGARPSVDAALRMDGEIGGFFGHEGAELW